MTLTAADAAKMLRRTRRKQTQCSLVEKPHHSPICFCAIGVISVSSGVATLRRDEMGFYLSLKGTSPDVAADTDEIIATLHEEGLPSDLLNEIVRLNDEENLSFAEIADRIDPR